VIPLLIAVTPTLVGATRISEVDFKNFDYPWDPPGVEVPITWRWIEGTPKSSIRVKAGRFDFPSSHNSLPDGYLTVWSIAYGDLNGDHQDEAAVDLLCSTGGTASWHYLYVFKLANGSPKLLGRLQSGSRGYGGLLKVQVNHNTLILDFADSERRVGDCCSEGYIRATYRWFNHRFVEIGKRVSGDAQLHRESSPR
jgi:hypothetical protein